MPKVEDGIKRRLLWRCRRGTKELDLILQHFVESAYQGLSKSNQARFDELLEIQDPLLTEWLYHGAAPEERFLDVVQAIRRSMHFEAGDTVK